jgi:hypothetical protein
MLVLMLLLALLLFAPVGLVIVLVLLSLFFPADDNPPERPAQAKGEPQPNGAAKVEPGKVVRPG